MTKKSDKNLNILRTKRAFEVKQKAFIIFKGLLIVRNCLRPESVPLTLSVRRSLSYRNQFIDLLCKSMDWFLYGRDLRHERVEI